MARLTVAGLLVSVPASVLFRLHDPRIDEASGIAAGVRSPGVVYVNNDSGDTNRVFALDGRTGGTDAVVTVTGAINHDWEDLAAAPDAAGTPSLWIADTGDNDARRAEVALYRVDEPHVLTGHDVTTARADMWRVRYPGGPVDVEALAVAPDGTPYLVTKALSGLARVYRLPRTPDRFRVRTATQVGTVTLTGTGTPNPFGVLGTHTATGAAISVDGAELAVRTYADVWLWRIDAGGGVAAALRGRPVHVPLPEQPQGEGVAFDGARLLIDSEGAGTAVQQVTLPPAAARPTTSSPSTPSRVVGERHARLPSRRVWAIAVLAALAVAALAAWIVRRRR